MEQEKRFSFYVSSMTEWFGESVLKRRVLNSSVHEFKSRPENQLGSGYRVNCRIKNWKQREKSKLQEKEKE